MSLSGMLGSGSLPPLRSLQFRHDCQHLGCANPTCPQCALCQRRRCVGNFASKYLAPCDVLEAKCGAQVYVVVIDSATGALAPAGLSDCYLQLSLVDGRRLEHDGPIDEALSQCELLVNKAGCPLLAHGRSGHHSEECRVLVPMIAGQAMLPDLKVTDSSEALLTGRAPPFRLLARAVHRGGMQVAGVAPVLSEPFVVATARVKGAAKAEIPHVDDHISKLEGLGVQTQKKLEDIAAAAAVAGVPNVQVPHNCVTKVGQFRDLVETAERSKSLRETLKQILRLTKGWDVAREHVRRAVHTDTSLRVFHPDWYTGAGLVFRCGTFNVIDIEHPVGLLRRRQMEGRPDQEVVDVLWLSKEPSQWPEAVRRLVPQATVSWWRDGHPGWALLPLTLAHLPALNEVGNPVQALSTYSFTTRNQQELGEGGQGVGTAPSDPPAMVTSADVSAWTQLAPSSAMFNTAAGGFRPVGFNAAVPTGPASQRYVPGFPPAAPSPELLPGMIPSSAVDPAAAAIANNPAIVRSGNAAGGTILSRSALSAGGGPSPFEDPSFQQMMQAIASNNGVAPAPGGLSEGAMRALGSGLAPPSGDSSDGGAKGKRKADTSLDTWMAMHKSLNYDFSLPTGMAGLDSLMANMPPGSTRAITAAAAAAAAALPAPPQQRPASGGTAQHVPLSEFLAATQQHRANQRVQQEALAIGTSIPPAVTRLADNAPATMPANVTMGQLRAMFAKAMQQKIPFQELEGFLKGHGLLPEADALESGGNADDDHTQRMQEQVAPEIAVMPKEEEQEHRHMGVGVHEQHVVENGDGSLGLETMHSMENELPEFADPGA